MSDFSKKANVDKNVEGIMQEIRKYMVLREQQACRMNPSLSGVITDLVWIQLKKLSVVLQGYKNYGPEKYRVADIMASWDDAKKREFFQPANQNSILHEISPRDDGDKKHQVGDVGITDLRTLFKALNPQVESVVGLIETWIIWDLQDASDVFNYFEQINRLKVLRVSTLPEEVFSQYAVEMSLSAGERPTQSQVFAFEFNRLKHLLSRFASRRAAEQPHQMIIARQSQKDSSAADQEITAIARHCRALEMLRALPADAPLDAKYVAYYKNHLGIDESMVTVDLAREYEVTQIREGKMKLRPQLASDDDSVPYDYKKMQEQELIQIAKNEQIAAESYFSSVEGVASPDAATAPVLPSVDDSMTLSGIFKLEK